MTDIITLQIELVGADPAVSRTVEVPLSMRLDSLHDTIQAAMGWQDSHLHLFRIGGRDYGVADPDWSDVLSERKLTLADALEAGKRSFEYVYDMGDDWLHKVKFGRRGKAAEGLLYPRLVEGRGACPPEDSGGIWGYMEKLEIMNDPSHRDHEDIMDWLGGPIDPEAFDMPEAMKQVAAVAEGLAKPKARRPRQAP